jgi:hypothetical protein
MASRDPEEKLQVLPVDYTYMYTYKLPTRGVPRVRLLEEKSRKIWYDRSRSRSSYHCCLCENGSANCLKEEPAALNLNRASFAHTSPCRPEDFQVEGDSLDHTPGIGGESSSQRPRSRHGFCRIDPVVVDDYMA